MPLQSVLGRWIATTRTPRVQKLYSAIGGGSPLRPLSLLQAAALSRAIARRSSARHDAGVAREAGAAGAGDTEEAAGMAVVALRYTAPRAGEAVQQLMQTMRPEGGEGRGGGGRGRVVLFPQYPQWSCATSGSSLNDWWRAVDHAGARPLFSWSIIDRWFAHPSFIDVVARRVRHALLSLPTSAGGVVDRDAVILFSAHSLPIKAVNRGDPYPAQIAATTHLVTERLKADYNICNMHYLCYQSQVGRVTWLGPKTDTVCCAYC
jgi:protoporphyrin/coproporphyrin ferrochelatase